MGNLVRFIQDSTITNLQEKITQHDLYRALDSSSNLKIFMEHHVFAVWDFMSIVKSLQQEIAGVTIPWIPPKDIEAARLINEIVLGEETDSRADGSFASHFHLYLEAMQEVGANPQWIQTFLGNILEGHRLDQSLERSKAPEIVCSFVQESFNIIEEAKVHVLASALFYGREDLIPNMFQPMIESLHKAGTPCAKLLYYLERHVDLDSGDHSRWAEQLLQRLCAGKPEYKEEARTTAIRVLKDRLRFWDGILESIQNPSEKA